MLTLFALPKAFRGHIRVIQRNAIQSWIRLRPGCEIILFGNDDGVEETAAEFGVRHVPDVARNEFGTPQLNVLFDAAQRAASYPRLCYVNADIILMSDFLPAVTRVAHEFSYSLLVGRRWDLDIREPLDFSVDWERSILSLLRQRGRLHAHTGIDYFVFPSGLFRAIPPFAIGRTTWDGWLLYRARKMDARLIDATQVLTAVHQNHEYSHVQSNVWKGPEATKNLALAGGRQCAYTLLDVQYKLSAHGIHRHVSAYVFYRSLLTLSARYPVLEPAIKLVRYLRDKLPA